MNPNQEEDPFAVFTTNKKRKPNPDIKTIDTISKKVHTNQIDQSHQLQSNNDIKNIVEQQMPQVVQNRQSDQDKEPQDIEIERNPNMLQDIQIEVQKSQEGCFHQTFYPKNYQRNNYDGPYNAKSYPFKLDPFQAKAVHSIECDQSVLVCAHTSAGKTAVAEYAIAKSLKNNSRVIYTSPIKALSNQKYRQLKDEFNDVGLMTGDASIDQDATCLVMTTEILRNMIYRGSEVVRQTKWVIFDQVHYMRDKQRGVVWEQTIIMLPANVKYVFLSATIGNPSQFARWITKLRRQPCNVVYTDYRPVPLQHYMCPAGGQGIFMVVDDTGKFHQDQFNKSIQTLGQDVGVVGVDKKKKKNLNQGSDLSKIIKVIMERNLDPVIVFSFSKKDVQAYAKSVTVKYDLTTKAQKERITEIYNNAVSVLGEDSQDKKIKPITSMLPILQKGIGIHHGGLLPLVKQVIQLLFQDGLIKILFSTQTFSMGLNMPAKTVVFTSIRKWDGEKTRWITGGQYIQMSGRAGRRGKDKKGMTILMVDQKIEPEIAKSMLKGKSDDLNSSFYINYNMLLNSQRLEDIDPDYILARSFLQFQHQSKLPAIIEQHKQRQARLTQKKFDQQELLERLYLINQKINEYKDKVRQLTFTPQAVLQYLSVGRIVRVKDGDTDWGYGVSINFNRKDRHKKLKGEQANDSTLYVVDVMIYIKIRIGNQPPRPASFEEQGQVVVIPFALSCIHQITTFKISNLPSDLTSISSKNLVLKTLAGVAANKKIPLISIGSTNPQAHQFTNLIKKSQEERQPLQHLSPQLQTYKQKRKMYEEIVASSKKIKQMSGIILRKEKKGYNRVIKRTGLVQKNVVTLKGSVACQISSNHQILLTNLLFDGYFNDLSQIEIASILVTVVHQEKSNTDKRFTKIPKIKAKIDQLLNHAKKLFLVLKQCKVQIQQDEYIGSIKEQLVEATYEWCRGATFQTICSITDSYEGSIIRTFRRLNQLLMEMSSAALVIGNQELSERFKQSSTKLYRGLVSAASLYLV